VSICLKLLTQRKQIWHKIYAALGGYTNHDPDRPATDRLWTFNHASVDGPGAYVDMVQNIVRISDGALPISNPSDEIDMGKPLGFVLYYVGERRHKVAVKVRGDMADMAMFRKWDDLARQSGSAKRMTYLKTGPQQGVFGFETPQALAALRAATGLDVQMVAEVAEF
jgi:hypothetical protein